MTLQKFLYISLFIVLFNSNAISQPFSETVTNRNDSACYNQFFPKNVAITDSIVNYGKLFLNKPYRYGSPGADTFDCSGFTSFVYRNFGISLGRSSVDQAQQFDTVSRHQLKKGDLVYFSGRGRSKRVGHVGIVTTPKENGEFEFIHAAVHKGITISSSEEPYYTKRYIKANRVIGGNPLVSSLPALAQTINPSSQPEIITPFAGPVKQTKQTSPAEYHTVKSGETLAAIAEKYDMTVDELKEMNKLKSNKLKRKQQIKVKDEETVIISDPIIPSGASELATNTSKTEEPKTETTKTTKAIPSHIVKKGETLFSISKEHNISIEKLKSINKLESEKITFNQEILLDEQIAQLKPEKELEKSKSAIHKVKRGESLYTISKLYNISTEDLKRINKLKNNNINFDQEIKVSKTEVQLADTKSAKSEDKNAKVAVHKVKKGESLYTISKLYNISVDELVKLNKLENNKLRLNQEIKITPEKEQVAQIANSKAEKSQNLAINAKSETDSKTLTHKVQKGENLSIIAQKYHTTIDEIIKINNLQSNKLLLNQEIKIASEKEQVAQVINPKSEKSQNLAVNAKSETDSKTLIHKVQKGENLSVIAQKYHTTIDEIIKINNLQSNKLRFNQEIKIASEKEQVAQVVNSKAEKAAKPTAVKKEAETPIDTKQKSITVAEMKTEKPSKTAAEKSQITTTKPETNSKTLTHKVQKGENLSTIAQKYHTTIDEIKKINNLENEKLLLDQEIKVSGTQEQLAHTNTTKAETVNKPSTHKVQKGETLYTIAKQYNTSVEELQKINKLEGNKVQLDQEIKLSADKQKETSMIPFPKASHPGLTHIVKPGESLYTISAKYRISAKELKKINNLSGNNLQLGQELIVSTKYKPSTSERAKEVASHNTTHTVKSGDSFSTIAKEYGCTVEQIKEWNKKSDDKLSVGERIVISK